MPNKSRKLSDLIQEVLDERAQAVNLSPDQIEAGVMQLRQRFREVRERAAAQRQANLSRVTTPSETVQGSPEGGQRRLRYEAVLRPGAYRLRLGNLTLRVILGEARRTSRILIDAARDLLTPDPGAWGIVLDPAPATRGGADDASRVEIAQQAGLASGTVIADDTGEERRVLVVIRGFPADQPVPIIELGEETPEAESVRVVQIVPEIAPERAPSRGGRQRE
jgi:hypothetical protein